MEESRPPGVLRLMMTRESPSRSALSIVLTMYSAEIGWIGASTVIFRIAADEMAEGRSRRRRRREILARTLSLL
jgi:hypothetical protein